MNDSKITLLFIDDEPDTARLLCDGMQSFERYRPNYRVVDGRAKTLEVVTAECLDAIATVKPDVVILDIRLSQVHRNEGLDVCRAIKTGPAPGVIVILLSTRFADADQGVEAGANGFYFNQRWDFTLLELQIRSLVQAREANYKIARLEAVESFAQGVAHDLKNSLLAVSSLLTSTESLVHEINNLPGFIPNLKEILVGLGEDDIKAAWEAKDLSTVFLNAMDHRGSGGAQVESKILRDVVDAAMGLRRMHCKKHGVGLVFLAPTTAVRHVLVREAELLFSIVELISNAVWAFQENRPQPRNTQPPVIQLSIRDDGNRVHLDVADTGPGADDYERIIVARETTRQHLGGTGRGLWLMRRRLAEFGGEIHGKPNQPYGSVFTISLQPAAVR